MGKSTISMAIFNSKLFVSHEHLHFCWGFPSHAAAHPNHEAQFVNPEFHIHWLRNANNPRNPENHE